MNQIYPNEGLVEQLTRILSQGIRVKLFKNDIDPDKATVVGDLTEADWTGYASVDMDDTDFTLTGISGDAGYALAAPITFANGSGSAKSAYGYYVTTQDDATLLAAARFDSAPITKADGEQWVVTPVWGDSSEF